MFRNTAEIVGPGVPWTQAGVTVTSATPVRIQFPKLTKWFAVINRTSALFRLGFTENGVQGSNFITMYGGVAGWLPTLFPLSVPEIWLVAVSTTTTVDVIAGLSLVDRNHMPVLTGALGPTPGHGWPGVG